MSNLTNTRLEERAVELAGQLGEAQLEWVAKLIDDGDLEVLFEYEKRMWYVLHPEIKPNQSVYENC